MTFSDHIGDVRNMVPDIAHDVDYAARLDPWVPRESALLVYEANGRGGAFTEREMRAALTEAGWPEHEHARALRIFHCESRYNPAAVGDGGLSLGVAQMGVAGWRTVDGVPIYWQGWFRYFGVDEALAFDIITNLTVARWAFERSGWGPWSCA